jgi:murein lipoprotein
MNQKNYHYRDTIMLLKKIAIAAFAVALTGCANTDALEGNISTLTSKVDALSSQVNELQGQQKALSQQASDAKAAAESAKAAALEANERINNVVASYKK